MTGFSCCCGWHETSDGTQCLKSLIFVRLIRRSDRVLLLLMCLMSAWNQSLAAQSVILPAILSHGSLA